MKKGIMSSFIILGVLLSGCGSQKEELYSSSNPVDITVWTYYNGDQLSSFNTLVKKFNRTQGKENGIYVESVSCGTVNDLEKNLKDSIEKKVGASEIPDMFSAYNDIAYTIDQMHGIVDLNKYFSDDELDEYIEGYVQDGNILNNGKLKVFPIAKSTEILTINKTDFDIFAKATNVSSKDLSTIEGLVEVSQKYYEWTDSLTPKPNDGKAFFGRDAMANYILAGSMQLGHEIFKVKNGKMKLDYNEKVARKLWDNYYIPYIKGYFTASGVFRTDDIKTGNIIGYVGSSSSATYFPKTVTNSNDETYSIKMETLPCPQFKDSKNYAIQQGTGMAVMKTTKTKQQAAVEFLKWLTDTKQNVQFSKETGYLPVKKEANKVEPLVDNNNNMDTQKVVEVSIDTVKENAMYSPKAFKQGTTARAYLQSMMADKATEDRQVVETNLKNGQDLDQATASFTSDEYFEQWYQETKTQLQTYED